jgi:hypothetical protein
MCRLALTGREDAHALYSGGGKGLAWASFGVSPQALCFFGFLLQDLE